MDKPGSDCYLMSELIVILLLFGRPSKLSGWHRRLIYNSYISIVFNGIYCSNYLSSPSGRKLPDVQIETESEIL